MSYDAQAAPAAPQPSNRFVFGLTLDQVDALGRLTGILIANGDVISIGRTAPLDEQTMPTLGEAIYDAGYAVRSILAQVEEQRLGPPVGLRAPSPAFPHDLHNSLRETHAVARLLRTALRLPDAAHTLPGISAALHHLLGRLMLDLEAAVEAPLEPAEEAGHQAAVPVDA
jgi:hypothetical protein